MSSRLQRNFTLHFLELRILLLEFHFKIEKKYNKILFLNTITIPDDLFQSTLK